MYLLYLFTTHFFVLEEGIRWSPDPDNNITINLTMAQKYNIAQHYVETPNNYCQPELITCGPSPNILVVRMGVSCNHVARERVRMPKF
jgi:hypothetical protein